VERLKASLPAPTSDRQKLDTEPEQSRGEYFAWSSLLPQNLWALRVRERGASDCSPGGSSTAAGWLSVLPRNLHYSKSTTTETYRGAVGGFVRGSGLVLLCPLRSAWLAPERTQFPHTRLPPSFPGGDCTVFNGTRMRRERNLIATQPDKTQVGGLTPKLPRRSNRFNRPFHELNRLLHIPRPPQMRTRPTFD